MCDLISDVVTCYVRICDMGKINEYDKIVFDNQKQVKMDIKYIFYINLHLKDRLDIEFTDC